MREEVSNIKHRIARTGFLKVDQRDPAVFQYKHLVVIEIIMRRAARGPIANKRAQRSDSSVQLSRAGLRIAQMMLETAPGTAKRPGKLEGTSGASRHRPLPKLMQSVQEQIRIGRPPLANPAAQIAAADLRQPDNAAVRPIPGETWQDKSR